MLTLGITSKGQVRTSVVVVVVIVVVIVVAVALLVVSGHIVFSCGQ